MSRRCLDCDLVFIARVSEQHDKHYGAADCQSGQVEHKARNEEVEHVAEPLLL
jgi:hypothetical protein